MLQYREEKERIILQRHESVAEETARRLLVVCDRIMAEPHRFDMDTYWSSYDEVENEVKDNRQDDCGTFGCIAGWADYIWGTAKDQEIPIAASGRKHLGLSHAQSEWLFFEEQWPFECRPWNLEHRTDVCDEARGKRVEFFVVILGGIGYIVGLSGIAMYLKGRKSK